MKTSTWSGHTDLVGLSSKSRPISVAFRDYYDPELILQEAPSLKSIRYSVCSEITETRNKLWLHYRAARETLSNKVSIMYPARFIVNGETTHDWFTVMKRNRTQMPDNESKNTLANGKIITNLVVSQAVQVMAQFQTVFS